MEGHYAPQECKEGNRKKHRKKPPGAPPAGGPSLPARHACYAVPHSLDRRPVKEGTAVIDKPVLGQRDTYTVLLRGRPVRRLVHRGAFQSNPDEILESLLREWRATVDPGPFSEFDFPEDEEGGS